MALLGAPYIYIYIYIYIYDISSLRVNISNIDRKLMCRTELQTLLVCCTFANGLSYKRGRCLCIELLRIAELGLRKCLTFRDVATLLIPAARRKMSVRQWLTSYHLAERSDTECCMRSWASHTYSSVGPRAWASCNKAAAYQVSGQEIPAPFCYLEDHVPVLQYIYRAACVIVHYNQQKHNQHHKSIYQSSLFV